MRLSPFVPMVLLLASCDSVPWDWDRWLTGKGRWDDTEWRDTYWYIDQDDEPEVDPDEPDGDPAFEPAYWMVRFMFGWVDGVPSPVSVYGTEMAPTVEVLLAEEAYLDTWEDRYVCTLTYTCDGTLADWSGGAHPVDASFNPHSSQTDCEVDPNLWGDLEATFWMEWGLVGGPLEGELAEMIRDAGMDPAGFLGGDFILDGVGVGQSSGVGQVLYGMAWALDDDGASTEEPLDPALLESGVDAFLVFEPAYLFGF